MEEILSKFSLFCDETMAGKNVVGGGFSLSGFGPNDCTGMLSGKALGDQSAIKCFPPPLRRLRWGKEPSKEY